MTWNDYSSSWSVSFLFLEEKKEVEGYISIHNRYHANDTSESESNFLYAGFFGLFLQEGKVISFKKMLH